MKRTIIAILTGFFILSLAVASVSATTWLTYREDASLASGHFDCDLTYYHNSTGATNSTINVTLPCYAHNLSGVWVNISANGSKNLRYSLYVNGVAINTSATIAHGNTNSTTLADIISKVTLTAVTYLRFDFNANNTQNRFKIEISANDVNFTPAWIAANLVVKERDVNTPTISNNDLPGSSFWTVNDSVNVSNSVGYTLTDLNFTLAWPAHKLSAPATYLTHTTLANDTSFEQYYQYQKAGPYVRSASEKVEGTTHTVTVYVNSNEILTLCTNWNVDINEDAYEDYFGTLNYDTLAVELNGNDVDWTEGSIDMEDLTIRDQYSLNKFTFQWTTPSSGIPSGTTPGTTPSTTPTAIDWEQNIGGFPMWMLLLFSVIIICCVGILVYYEYYKKQK